MKGSTALKNVQKHFPQVKRVKDAVKPIRLSVTEKDNASATKKDPYGCAMAKACVRQLKADGAIINVHTSYVVKGDTAIRYKTSETVAREITSFDRHHHFEAGSNYLLSAISPGRRLDARKDVDAKGGPKTSKKGPPVRLHRTENIRVQER